MPARTLHKIDPQTNELVAEIQLPVADVRSSQARLAAGADEIWAAESGGNRIWKIDPATNGVVATLDLDTDFIIACFGFGSGSLWVTNVPGVYLYSDTLSRLDPSDGRVIESVAAPSSACGANGAIADQDGIAVGSSGVWPVPDESAPSHRDTRDD